MLAVTASTVTVCTPGVVTCRAHTAVRVEEACAVESAMRSQDPSGGPIASGPSHPAACTAITHQPVSAAAVPTEMPALTAVSQTVSSTVAPGRTTDAADQSCAPPAVADRVPVAPAVTASMATVEGP